MISDFLGSFLTPPPPISDFPPILKAFLHRDSPIFENLPPLPKIGYHLWTAPNLTFFESLAFDFTIIILTFYSRGPSINDIQF